MTIYSTSIQENAGDRATFTNPFDGITHHRGKLQVRVDQDEIVSKSATEVMGEQMRWIPPTTHPDFPAIIDPTHIALGPFISGIGDNLFLDCVLGVGTSAVFGYNHPKVFPHLARLGTMLSGYIAAGTDFFFASRHGAPTAQDLARLMCQQAEKSFGAGSAGGYMMNFANAGTEANENAVKVAMFHKYREIKKMLSDEQFDEMCKQLGITLMRPEMDDLRSNYPFFLMAFHGAFHGRTATSNSLSMSKRRQKEGYQAVPYVVHVPYGANADFDGKVDYTPLAELIENGKLKATIDSGRVPADLLAALIMEPVQGEGGYVIPDSDFLSRVDAFVGKMRKRGMCLISDEVQTGLYRTGKFAGMENWSRNHPNLRPDILSYAKPLHVGGVLVDKRLLSDWPAGKFSGTWAEGNLLGIATAYYTLKELAGTDESLADPYPEHAIKSGQYLRDSLSKMSERLEKKLAGKVATPVVVNIRGLGQMNAFDVPDADFQSDIVYQSFLNGMHILGTGERSMRLFGTVDQRPREADMIVSILEDVIEKVALRRCTPKAELSSR